MKLCMTVCLHLSLISLSFANGSGVNIDQRPRGTAEVDEAYTEELKIRKSREEMNENPRNRAMVESFGNVSSQEEKAQLQEEKKIEERKKWRNKGR